MVRAPIHLTTLVVLLLSLAGCAGSETASNPGAPSEPPYEPPILQETVSGDISAVTSSQCSTAFVRSVHPNYYQQGTNRCVEFSTNLGHGRDRQGVDAVAGFAG